METGLADLTGNPPWPYINPKVLEKPDGIDRFLVEPQHHQDFPTIDPSNLYVPPLTESSPCHAGSGLDHHIKSQDCVTPSNPTSVATLNISPKRYVGTSSITLSDPLKVSSPAIAPTLKFPSAEPSSLAQKCGQSRLGRVVSRKPKEQKFSQSPPRLPVTAFTCTVPSCRARFKRLEHVKRHMASHSREKPHVCWVPGCDGRFTRRDNLQTHYYTHATRGGRNRYVATLDPFCSFFDPCFRGTLTTGGNPVYE